MPLDGEQPSTTSEDKTKIRQLYKAKNQKRVYDEAGYRLRAAGLCVRTGTDGAVEVLLVTGSANHEHWIVPGGGLEDGENASSAALREVEEEAGIRGEIEQFVGEFKDDDRRTRTSLYLLNVVEALDEWEDGRLGRDREWVTMPEALRRIKRCQSPLLTVCLERCGFSREALLEHSSVQR
uniref:diphosphoinositol-polyphosphate diphosphatase n=1 Tax=Steinernema glaseri TaxID=37863 RepID=A0A1I7YYG1_9BILA